MRRSSSATASRYRFARPARSWTPTFGGGEGLCSSSTRNGAMCNTCVRPRLIGGARWSCSRPSSRQARRPWRAFWRKRTARPGARWSSSWSRRGSKRHSSTGSCSERCPGAGSPSSTSTRPASPARRGNRSPLSCGCRRPAWQLRSFATAMIWRPVWKGKPWQGLQMLRTVALAGFAGLVIAVDWPRFEEPRSGGGRPFLLVVLAIAPILLRPLWLRLAGLAGAWLLAVWVAFSIPPQALWPGGEGFFGPLGSRFGRGFVDFYDYRLPFDPTGHLRMHEVILVAIFAFTLAVALAVTTRRVVLAVVLFLVGAGWPATLLAGGSEIGRGVVILAVVLVLLAGLTDRPSRLALVASAAVL